MGAILTLAVSFLVPKTYRAEIQVLVSDSSSKASLLADLASSAGFSGALPANPSGGDNQTAAYPKILVSEPVLRRTLFRPLPESLSKKGRIIIDALPIKAPSERLRWNDAIRLLRSSIRISTDPIAGIVDVTVDARDSVLAAYMANTLIDELNRFNVESRRSRGRNIREFIEHRLQEADQELAGAEDGLRYFRTTNLRIGNSPALALEQARLEREVERRAGISDLLSRQHELARIEEQRDTPTLSVIEPATPPIKKHSPRPIPNSLAAFGLVVGLFSSLEYVRRIGSAAEPPAPAIGP